MAYGKRDGFSYADDVPIKISERVKIPARVTLPISFNPSISLDLLEEYDFSLENQVLEFWEARKRAKEALEKEKANKIARDIEEFTQQTRLNSDQCNTSNDPVSDECAVNHVNSERLEENVPKGWQPTQILSPQPLVGREKNGSSDNEEDKKPINLEDFENQGGDPFDFVELQTINEIEELNNVFRGIVDYKTDYDKSRNEEPEAPLSNNRPTNDSPTLVNPFGWSEAPTTTRSKAYETRPESYPYTRPPDINRPQNYQNGPQYSQYNSVTETIEFPRLRSSKSTSDISVEKDDRAKASHSWRSQTPPPNTIGQTSTMETASGYSNINSLSNYVTKFSNHGSMILERESRLIQKNKQNSLPDPFDELELEQQQFVTSLVDMGFPIDRAGRAVKHLGMDDKKVVDHLCQVQGLIENGCDGNDAETALHLYDYNMDEAKKFLDLLVQFQDLGFEKDSARKALIRHKNDRDKALDSLLS